MAKKKNNSRYIPLKNYFIAVLIAAFAIFLVLYLFEWYKVKNLEKYGTSYLINSNTINLEIKDYEEIPLVLSETPSDYFIFINYLNVEETYNLEKDLKNVIDEHNLKDIFYYINVTKLKEKDGYLDRLNSALNLDNELESVPTILYYRNNKLAEVISNDKEIISADDLEDIIEKYEIDSN